MEYGSKHTHSLIYMGGLKTKDPDAKMEQTYPSFDLHQGVKNKNPDAIIEQAYPSPDLHEGAQNQRPGCNNGTSIPIP